MESGEGDGVRERVGDGVRREWGMGSGVGGCGQESVGWVRERLGGWGQERVRDGVRREWGDFSQGHSGSSGKGGSCIL